MRDDLAGPDNCYNLAVMVAEYSAKLSESEEHGRTVYSKMDVLVAMPDKGINQKWMSADIMQLAKEVREQQCIKKYGVNCFVDPDKDDDGAGAAAPKKRKAWAAAAPKKRKAAAAAPKKRKAAAAVAPKKAAKNAPAWLDDAEVDEFDPFGEE